MIARVLREPLIHFLIGGMLIFLVSLTVGKKSSDDRDIIVDRESLIQFMQYRLKLFRPEIFEKKLDRMPEDKLQTLILKYIDDEILYREAMIQGLDKSDDVIRQRLIQKSRFILEEDNNTPPTSADLQSYFEKHANRYTSGPFLTFTHVFLDIDIHGQDSQKLAERMIEDLNRNNVSFSDAPSFGDQFPFLTNYVNRPIDFVASQFGGEAIQSLREMSPDENRWQGPVKSAYGWHAVLLIGSTPKKKLDFGQVQDEVAQAYMDDRRLKNRAKAIDRLRKNYQVKIDLGRPRSGNGN